MKEGVKGREREGGEGERHAANFMFSKERTLNTQEKICSDMLNKYLQ